jgi:hypothetical protein
MNVKNQFLSLGNFILQSGTQIRFWKDTWIGNSTLKEQYPNLYNIARRRNSTVADVLNSIPFNMSFRRALVGHNLYSWNSLVLRSVNIHLNDNEDVFKWSLTTSGQLTVRSMYNTILNENIMPNNRFLWRTKLPLKVKIFLWFMFKGVILTKDNLIKRNWHGTESYCFCNNKETIQHLFFDCVLARFVWRTIELTFGLNPPMSVGHISTSWLQNIPTDDKKLILVGAGAMCWSIWLSWNDVVFNKSPICSFIQVIFRGTHWTQT